MVLSSLGLFRCIQPDVIPDVEIVIKLSKQDPQVRSPLCAFCWNNYILYRTGANWNDNIS